MDPNFHKTLVYIAQHDAEGAMGLVMNRPLGKNLAEVTAGPGMSEVLSQVPVFTGGPVRPETLLVALFEKVGTEVTCRLDAPLEQAEAMVQSGDGWVRAFAGYAGWSEGQLDGEMTEKAWTVCTPDPFLFNDKLTSGLWAAYLSGDDRWRTFVDFLPLDPSRN